MNFLLNVWETSLSFSKYVLSDTFSHDFGISRGGEGYFNETSRSFTKLKPSRNFRIYSSHTHTSKKTTNAKQQANPGR